jgi:hypothetical protein
MRGKRERNSKSRKKQKDRLYIVHGPMQKTEMNYFTAMIQFMGDTRQCSIIPKTQKLKSNTCDPVELVEKAIAFLSEEENQSANTCWVLGDHDERFDLQKAIRLANQFTRKNKRKQ